jgi:hypothetical protein
MPGEYRAIWSVPGGGTGYSVLHCQSFSLASNADDFAAATRAFFNSCAGLFPDDIQINFDSEVLELTDAGVLTAVHAVTPPAVVNGTATGTFSRAAGARVDWATNQIVGGRRLTGRTYMVPLTAGSFDTEGVLTSAAITTLTTAAGTFITTMAATGSDLAVWSRTHATTAPVETASAPQKGAILRGRRD